MKMGNEGAEREVYITNGDGEGKKRIDMKG